MQTVRPKDTAEFAEAYGIAYAANARIRIRGNGSKWRFAGPVCQADVAFETTALTAIREYDPRDLTISVGAGMPYVRLIETLAKHKQMLPFDGLQGGE